MAGSGIPHPLREPLPRDTLSGMSPVSKRLLRVVAVVTAQLLLCWAAVELLGVRTESSFLSHTSGNGSGSYLLYVTLRGYPTPWREAEQPWRVVWDWPNSPPARVGNNPAVP